MSRRTRLVLGLGSVAGLGALLVWAVGAPCVCAGVIVAEGPSLIGLKAILTAAFMLASGPVLAHATARAIHLHRRARA